MDFLKTLPIAYRGKLQQVRVVNFSVEKDEIAPLIPKGIRLRDFDGKAVISMVDIKLKQMRPEFLPKILSLTYRHVAFRVLIDDSGNHDDGAHGIYFLKSFCTAPCLVCGGALFTDYRLTGAEIRGERDFSLRQGLQFLRYSIKGSQKRIEARWEAITASLYRAYARHGHRIWQTSIAPKLWPLEAVTCHDFKTNFFKSASLLNAFEVTDVLDFYRSAPTVFSNAEEQRRDHLPMIQAECSPL